MGNDRSASIGAAAGGAGHVSSGAGEVTFAGVEISREIVIFAVAAAALGLWVVLASLWRAIHLLGDMLAARACLRDAVDVRTYLERRSAFAAAVRVYVAANPRDSTVSADTVAVLAVDALENAAHAQTDGLRYWAYTPLLAGLCGTVVGLIALLRSDPDAMQQHLGGVLFGTLSGVGTTMVASSVVAWLAALATAGQRTTLTLVFRKLIPAIPDKKITIAVEHKLLEVIEARSIAIVERLKQDLSPLAASLSESARQSTQAATDASQAFVAVAHAIEKAPILARIVSQVIQAAQSADAASRRLASDAEKLAVLHEAETTSALALNVASTGLRDAADKLTGTVEAIRVGVVGEAPSLASVVGTIDTETKALNAQIALVAKQVSGLNQELIGLSAELKTFAGAQVKALSDRLSEQVQLLVGAVRQQLEGAPGRTSAALQRVGSDAETLSQRINNAAASLEGLERRTLALTGFINERIQGIPQAPPVARPTERPNKTFTEEPIASPARSAASFSPSSNALHAERPRATPTPSPKKRFGLMRRIWRRLPFIRDKRA